MCSQQGRNCCLVQSFLLWDKHELEELWKMRFLNSTVPWLYSWSSFNSVFRSSFNSMFSWVVVPSESIVIWSFRAYAVRETVTDLCTWLVWWKVGRLNNVPTRQLLYSYLLWVLILWGHCFVSNTFVLMHILNVNINEHCYKQRGKLLFITDVKLVLHLQVSYFFRERLLCMGNCHFSFCKVSMLCFSVATCGKQIFDSHIWQGTQV